MSGAADLAEAQALRRDALALVRADLARLQAALAEKPVTVRLREEALHSAARTAASTATRVADIAIENKPVLAATGLALVGWTFRRQLGALVQSLRRK